MKKGDTLHGYTVESVTDIPEFELVAVQLTHNKTSAKHLHLSRDDDNNSFGYVCLQQCDVLIVYLSLSVCVMVSCPQHAFLQGLQYLCVCVPLSHDLI